MTHFVLMMLKNFIFYLTLVLLLLFFFFFQAEDGIRDLTVTGVQTCALPISPCCIKLLADARFEQHGGGALAHPALDLRGIAFLLGAVCREAAQLLLAVGRGAPGERGLQQPLRDEVREAAGWRGGGRGGLQRPVPAPLRRP